MVKITNTATGSTFVATGYVYRRDENDTLFMCVSFIDEDGHTNSNEFTVDDGGNPIHPDYEVSFL